MWIDYKTDLSNDVSWPMLESSEFGRQRALSGEYTAEKLLLKGFPILAYTITKTLS